MAEMKRGRLWTEPPSAKELFPDLRPCADGASWPGLLLARFLDHAVALRTQLEKRFRLLIKAGHIAVDDRLPDDAGSRLRPEVILVVEAMHHLHDVVHRQA